MGKRGERSIISVVLLRLFQDFDSRARPTPFARVPGLIKNWARNQYLGMLFGGNTTKPKIQICRFVEEAIERTVTPMKALDLLERRG